MEEERANSNKLTKTLEQKEERIRNVKSRLEEAVHQNNKMSHALELKDDKLHSLETRSVHAGLGFKPLSGEGRGEGGQIRVLFFIDVDDSNVFVYSCCFFSRLEACNKELLKLRQVHTASYGPGFVLAFYQRKFVICLVTGAWNARQETHREGTEAKRRLVPNYHLQAGQQFKVHPHGLFPNFALNEPPTY